VTDRAPIRCFKARTTTNGLRHSRLSLIRTHLDGVRNL
jgi:hypothetical protein